MNNVIMDEGKVFDACALVEQIVKLSADRGIKSKAQDAANLLNQALEEGEKVEENCLCVD